EHDGPVGGPADLGGTARDVGAVPAGQVADQAAEDRALDQPVDEVDRLQILEGAGPEGARRGIAGEHHRPPAADQAGDIGQYTEDRRRQHEAHETGYHRVAQRVEGHQFHGVEFLADAHGAELGRDEAAALDADQHG